MSECRSLRRRGAMTGEIAVGKNSTKICRRRLVLIYQLSKGLETGRRERCQSHEEQRQRWDLTCYLCSQRAGGCLIVIPEV